MITNTYGGQAGDMNFPDNQVEMYTRDVLGVVDHFIESELFTKPDFIGNQSIYQQPLIQIIDTINHAKSERDDVDSILQRLLAILDIFKRRNIVDAEDFMAALTPHGLIYTGEFLRFLNALDALNEESYQELISFITSSFGALAEDFENLNGVRTLVTGEATHRENKLTDEA
jgi:hypothetical protein